MKVESYWLARIIELLALWSGEPLSSCTISRTIDGEKVEILGPSEEVRHHRSG